jgi:endonuclease YncB( thermonuclease family)
MGNRPAAPLVLAACLFGCGDRPPPAGTAAHPSAVQPSSASTGHMADGFSEEALASSGYGPADHEGGLTQRTCVRVIDCDTIELDGGERIRHIGINTPETVHPRKPIQRMGRERRPRRTASSSRARPWGSSSTSSVRTSTAGCSPTSTSAESW